MVNTGLQCKYVKTISQNIQNLKGKDEEIQWEKRESIKEETCK